VAHSYGGICTAYMLDCFGKSNYQT